MDNLSNKGIDTAYGTNAIMLFCGTDPKINYYARTTTSGKEFELVSKYIDYLIKKYSRLKRKQVAIFIEPQIDTGYPDIVVAEFQSIPPLQWVELRNNLSAIDIKLLFYIQVHTFIDISEMQTRLGYSKEELHKSISKLSKCGLINTNTYHSIVRPIPLKEYCRINKLISIEAKIDKWHEAIRQAGNNTWFSTESYVLLNKTSCSDTIKNICRENGIGVILVNGKVKTILASNQRRFPVSYASLQFNEWIMRYINKRS